ncbi:hypothetical protein MHYP_G00274230 [Metynnis hypsauchen]
MSARRCWCWLTFACLAQVWCCARASSFCTAYLSVQVNYSASALPGNLTTWRREAGLFGRESPRYELKARVLLAEPVHACSADTRFRGARREPGWIALMKRGSGCTFTEKINRAAARGAAAALIYNEDGTENTVIQMAHPETQTFLLSSEPVRPVFPAELDENNEECVGPDADSCAVCIEVYKPGDVLSVLTCSHFFHKVCVEPWLLEHRTCPMCKSDVLKALGVEDDEETPPDLNSSSSDESLTHNDTLSDSVSHTHISSVSHTLSDAASSGYESINSDTHTGLEVVCVETQPHYDNPAYERDPTFGRDPTL